MLLGGMFEVSKW